MKSFIKGLALTALLVGSGAQAGLKKGQFEFSPILGLSVPLGDFGDVHDAGLGFGVRGAYFISSRASVGISVTSNKMDFNNLFDQLALVDTLYPGERIIFDTAGVPDTLFPGARIFFDALEFGDSLVPGAEFDFSVVEINADFRYHFLTESNFSPYFSGTVGMSMNRLSGSATVPVVVLPPPPPAPQDTTVIQEFREATDSQSEITFGGSIGVLFRGQGNDAGFLEARIIIDSYDFAGARSGSTKYLSFRGGITFFFGGTE